jgi:hypothetical protein
MECCYIARRNAIDTSDLELFDLHLSRFHQLRKIFIETGVRMSISLPRQHALIHYVSKIELFGSPNGICSSITESMHIRAVKKPWRRSSRFKALAQIVKTITRLDKLASLRKVFRHRGMLDGTLSSYATAIVAGIRYGHLEDNSEDREDGRNDGMDSDDGMDNSMDSDDGMDNGMDLDDGMDDGMDDCSDDERNGDVRDDDDDGGPISDQKSLAQVTLAAYPGASQVSQ